MKTTILLSLTALAVMTGCSTKEVYTAPARFMTYDATNANISELSVATICKDLKDKEKVFNIGQTAQEAGISKIYYIDEEVTVNTKQPSTQCYKIYGK